MRTQLSASHCPCPAIRGDGSRTHAKVTSGKKHPVFFTWVLSGILALLLVPLPAVSQEDNTGHEGGGGGCGDVFGDMIHVLRDGSTGQPIFAQRWIELPKEIPGYGWGYCPIAVDEDGERLAFLPYSCEVDPLDADRVVETDYFGRLNGGRTKERNQRMHFDEVISNIKQAGQLRLDSTGRLELGFGDPELCYPNGNPGYCSWSAIDSPMENMALYVRLMRYGHFSTDPMEVDIWAKGDPAAGTQYHPALGEVDWPKFKAAGLDHLLANPDVTYCWLDGVFVSACALPTSLKKEDFNSADAYLGASANKTGKITVDLVQYLNRFLKITRDTEASLATTDTLPALYEDCWPEDVADPWLEGDEPPLGYDLTSDPGYLETCDVIEANPAMAGWEYYDDYTNVKERFMDFSKSNYKRENKAKVTTDLILEASVADTWQRAYEQDPFAWVADYPNPETPEGDNIQNFVDGASDVLRAIEYIHNYEVPEDLYCKYLPSDCL
jgi:hypothetical protein